MSHGGSSFGDLQPIPGGQIRASDRDRDEVARALGLAYAEGRLSLEEHDERVDRAMRAKTFDDLRPLTQDLVPITSSEVSAVPSTDSGYAIDTSRQSAEPDRMIAVFSGVNRRAAGGSGAATRRWRSSAASTSICARPCSRIG